MKIFKNMKNRRLRVLLIVLSCLYLSLLLVLAKAEPSFAIEDSSGVRIKASVPVNESGAIAKFSTSAKKYRQSVVDFTVNFENNGNVDYRLISGNVEIFDPEGNFVDQIEIDLPDSEIKGGQVVGLSVDWSAKGVPSFGKYEALCRLGYGSGKEIEAKTEFQIEKNTVLAQTLDLLMPVVEGAVAKGIKQITNFAVPTVVLANSLLPFLLNPSMYNLYARLMLSIYQLFGRRKSSIKPWGRVVDSESGQPIPLAGVKIFNAESNRLAGSQSTDKDGRFGFLVNPGVYFLSAAKKNYAFPSKSRGFCYRGGQFAVSGKEAINVTIMMDPELKTLASHLKLVNRLVNISSALRLPIFLLGTLVTIIFYVTKQHSNDLLILALYLVLWLEELYSRFHYRRSFGRVIDRVTGKPVDLSVIRVFDAENNKLISSRVSDRAGKFQFLVGKGSYYLLVAREGYEHFKSEVIKYGELASITHDFRLQPLEGKGAL